MDEIEDDFFPYIDGAEKCFTDLLDYNNPWIRPLLAKALPKLFKLVQMKYNEDPETIYRKAQFYL